MLNIFIDHKEMKLVIRNRETGKSHIYVEINTTLKSQGKESQWKLENTMR